MSESNFRFLGAPLRMEALGIGPVCLYVKDCNDHIFEYAGPQGLKNPSQILFSWLASCTLLWERPGSCDFSAFPNRQCTHQVTRDRKLPPAYNFNNC